MIAIRAVVPNDAAAIAAIYAPHVLLGTTIPPAEPRRFADVGVVRG